MTAARLLVQDIQQARQTQAGEVEEEGGEDIVGIQQLDVNLDPLQPPASVAQSLTELNAQLGDPLTYVEVAALTQRSLSAKIDAESARQLLLSQEDEREQARLRCLARAGAGEWLSACLPPQKDGVCHHGELSTRSASAPGGS